MWQKFAWEFYVISCQKSAAVWSKFTLNSMTFPCHLSRCYLFSMLKHDMDFGQVQVMEFSWHLLRKWWDFHRYWCHIFYFWPNFVKRDMTKSLTHFSLGWVNKLNHNAQLFLTFLFNLQTVFILPDNRRAGQEVLVQISVVLPPQFLQNRLIHLTGKQMEFRRLPPVSELQTPGKVKDCSLMKSHPLCRHWHSPPPSHLLGFFPTKKNKGENKEKHLVSL